MSKTTSYPPTPIEQEIINALAYRLQQSEQPFTVLIGDKLEWVKNTWPEEHEGEFLEDELVELLSGKVLTLTTRSTQYAEANLHDLEEIDAFYCFYAYEIIKYSKGAEDVVQEKIYFTPEELVNTWVLQESLPLEEVERRLSAGEKV